MNTAALTLADALDTPGVERDDDGPPDRSRHRHGEPAGRPWVADRPHPSIAIEELQLLGAGVAATATA